MRTKVARERDASTAPARHGPAVERPGNHVLGIVAAARRAVFLCREPAQEAPHLVWPLEVRPRWPGAGGCSGGSSVDRLRRQARSRLFRASHSWH